MANNSDIIKIGFDYESGLAEFIKNYNGTMGQVQKSADGNRIEIQFDVSDKDVIKKISAIQGDFKNVKIELNGKELTQQLSSIEAIKDVLISIIKMVNDGIKIDSILNLDKTFSQVNDLKKQISDLKSSMEKMHTDNDIAEAWNEGFHVGSEELEHFRESALESTDVIFKLRKELENLQAENQQLTGSNDYFKGITDSLSQSLDEAKSEIADLQKQLETLLKASPKTNISTPKNTTSDTAGASAKDSKVSIEGEADKLKETAQNATEAANAKLKFVDANKKVKDSAKDSADAVQGESDSFKNVNTDPYSTYVQNVYKAWQQADKINDALSETQQKFQSIENTFGKSATGGSRFEELFPGVTDAVKELDNKLQQSKISVASYKSQIKDLLETKPNNLVNSNQLYSEANQINTALNNVEKTINGLTVPSNFQNDFVNVKTEVEQLNEKLKEGKISVSEYNTAIDNSLGSLSDSIQNQLMSQSQLLSSVRSAINSANKNVEKQELKPSEVNRSDTFGKQIAEYKNAISELSAAYDSIKGKDFISDEEAAKISQLQNKVEALGSAFKSLDSSQKGSTEISRSKLYDKIGEYLQKNTRISAEFRSQLIALQEELKFKGADANVNKIATAFFNLKGNIKDAGQEGRRLLDIINDKAFYGFAAQIAGMFSVQDGLRLAQNAINTVVELDTALVDLKKTTSMTSTELNKFYYDANDVAKQMGVTTQEIIEQASAWSRLGYSSKEASTEMARLSSKFAAISPGMDTTEAQEGLVSIMKAFDVETSEVESKIINKINVLGNKFAENNQDVVEGLKRSSAAMAAMNQSFEDTAALFTGGMEILQDAESMGTALRTLSMRMRGYSEETGEFDNELVNLKGDVLDLTKTANNAQGISIFTDATQQHYKSMVQYLGEIADEWDQISEVNQTALLQKLFGKNRAQAGAAILGNFDQVRKAIQEMEDSAGSADREMEAIESSLEFKINRLKETWVGTAQQIADRGDIGKGIDALYEVSEAIGFIIDKVGILNIGIVGLTAALGRGRSQERFCPIW